MKSSRETCTGVRPDVCSGTQLRRARKGMCVSWGHRHGLVRHRGGSDASGTHQQGARRRRPHLGGGCGGGGGGGVRGGRVAHEVQLGCREVQAPGPHPARRHQGGRRAQRHLPPARPPLAPALPPPHLGRPSSHGCSAQATRGNGTGLAGIRVLSDRSLGWRTFQSLSRGGGGIEQPAEQSGYPRLGEGWIGTGKGGEGQAAPGRPRGGRGRGCLRPPSSTADPAPPGALPPPLPKRPRRPLQPHLATCRPLSHVFEWQKKNQSNGVYALHVHKHGRLTSLTVA